MSKTLSDLQFAPSLPQLYEAARKVGLEAAMARPIDVLLEIVHPASGVAPYLLFLRNAGARTIADVIGPGRWNAYLGTAPAIVRSALIETCRAYLFSSLAGQT